MNSTIRRTLPAVLLTAAVSSIAFAGGAVAADLVTGKDIKNNSVSTKDLKDGSVKGKDVKDGSLGEADLNKAAKSKLNAPSVKGYEVKTQTVTVGTAGQQTILLECSPGKVALSGGGSWSTVEYGPVIGESAPQEVVGQDHLFKPADGGFANGWAITGSHNGLDPADLTGYVICVNPS